ncbi:hypothetical protein GXM_06864 [Nostoc sphaeroides CCNUC1]|uniref:Uncharacterized protein n=1 Tax=Nostoc sphaeroides CCNUC1 TaxID=2653204 RepID=A0A5P8W9M6_9NOSO|nr:hypothetical protein GXM_06864 [Nostoc sphaeroides CCNUC1]
MSTAAPTLIFKSVVLNQWRVQAPTDSEALASHRSRSVS